MASDPLPDQGCAASWQDLSPLVESVVAETGQAWEYKTNPAFPIGSSWSE